MFGAMDSLATFAWPVNSLCSTKRLPFAFLISYETFRLCRPHTGVSRLALLPFFLIALYGLIGKIGKQNNLSSFLFVVLAIVLITTSFYLSYPRLDNYYNSHGYSVSQNDIKAVRWIDADSGEMTISYSQPTG